ncbi:MAG: chondroitinase-B domain-containing protein [Dysgonomonas sp.]
MKKLCLSIFFLVLCSGLFSAEYTYTPSQISSLKAKLKDGLLPGDIVYLADGTYSDFQVVFSGSGTAINPITLKAKNEGKVVLTGNINLKIGGSYLVVDGLTLKDGMAANEGDIIEFRTSSSVFANNCRLTNTVIDNCNNPDESYQTSTDKSERWVMLYGKNNRVDHCYFTNKTSGGVLMMVNIEKSDSQENNHLIDHNFFGYRSKFSPGNNAETIRLGDSKTSQLSCQTIVESNFFYTCNGEAEIVSIKSCDNIIRKNVFYESQGALVCRHGHRNTIESNAFIGNGVNDCGGVRVINQGHKIYNNFFQDLQGTGSRSALCVMMGIFEKPTSSTDLDKEPLNAYHQVKDVEISYNTFVNCKNVDLGTETSYTYSSSNPYYPNQKVTGTLKPECTIARNVFYNVDNNTILNRVASNDANIIYSNNIYRFKKTFTLSGFTYRALDYSASTEGAGKGIVRLNNTSDNILDAPDTGGTDFSYVSADLSGNSRPETKNMGALEFEHRTNPFVTVRLSECGTDWYPQQQADKTVIKGKTDFWENLSNISLSEIQQPKVQIISEGGKQFRIISETKISNFFVYNSLGSLVFNNQVQDYTKTINFSNLSSGIYYLLLTLANNQSYSNKILI